MTEVLPLTSPSRKLLDCACIVAVFALPLVILRPLQDSAVIDDWCYHWSVEHLLKTGKLQILEYSASIHPVQTLWGALFCVISGGFSFAADRLSTWVLGASTLCAVYLMALELGAPRRIALLGAAVLGASPIFFLLSFTFMTDIPAMAMMTWAVYALVCAVRKQSDRWLWAAALFASLAVGMRLPASVLPVAMFLTLLFHAGKWGRQPLRLAAAATPLLGLALVLLWYRSHIFISADLTDLDNSPVKRLFDLRHYTLPILHRLLGLSVIFTVSQAGACLLPLAMATVQIKRRWLEQILVSLAILVYMGIVLRQAGEEPRIPLSSGWTWRIEELGATTDLSPGKSPDKPYPPELIRSLHYAFLVAGASVILRGFTRRPVPGEAPLRWTLIGLVLLGAVLILLYDRYILPMLPILVVLALVALPPPRMGIALAGVILFATVSLLGMRDHLAYNGALWQAVRELHQEGVEPSQIDAGYVVNGWFQYAHPEDAPRDSSGKIFVPWLTTDDKLPYTIANKPRAGYEIVREHPVHRWMGPNVTVYVLRRQ